ncbi:hypothetical protein CDL12_27060 [Handroanthus impetiginosus]|uniref:Uncharacterized protein n=1 Tax=Handroanthus impetiginosus TaxID=429701 RepID=A0A2G9G550_9LAMI|nr:hypothetical protein CDL12_27060 [Handroanthus impetiginosus]
MLQTNMTVVSRQMVCSAYSIKVINKRIKGDVMALIEDDSHYAIDDKIKEHVVALTKDNRHDVHVANDNPPRKSLLDKCLQLALAADPLGPYSAKGFTFKETINEPLEKFGRISAEMEIELSNLNFLPNKVQKG